MRRVTIAVQVAVIVFVLALAGAVWITLHAIAAAGRLSDARADIARVRLDLVNGLSPTLDMQVARRDAAAAAHDTHDFVWSMTSWLPPVKTVQGITTAVDGLAQHALPALVRVGPSLAPGKLRIAHNQIALPPLRASAPVLAQAAVATAHARDLVAGLPGGWIGVIGDAREKVLAQLESLAGSTEDASRFAAAGPAMLGGHGTRRYFVGIENSAESRATGGLVAAYAIVTARHGRIHVVEHGNDNALLKAASPTVRLGAAYQRVYGNYSPASSWITSNLSPNFPDAANIWAHLWQAQSGERVDGVFGVDPAGLANMVAAAGPVSVAGYPGVYTGQNLAPFIEAREYQVFQGVNQQLRKNFLSEVATAVLHKLLSGSGDPVTITRALGASAGAGHLTLWSATPREQLSIAGTPLAGELPVTDRPFASVSVNSATGTKLDYYLDRTLTYQAGSCIGPTRQATISVSLDDDAPLTGLPAYVRLRGDVNNVLSVEGVPRQKLLVYVHATAGSAFESATLDGKPVLVSSGVERGHPVFSLPVTLQPKTPRTLEIHLQEPVRSGAPMTKVQPLPRLQRTRLAAPSCPG